MTDLRFEHQGAELSLSAGRSETGWRIQTSEGAAYEIAAINVQASVVSLTAATLGTDGARGPERILAVPAVRTGSTITISWKGAAYQFRPAARGSLSAPRPDESGAATAPNGGVVVEVLVLEGQQVDAFEQIAIIEAMKVMTPVESPRAGMVANLQVTKGQRIEQGAPIAQIVPMPEPTSVERAN